METAYQFDGFLCNPDKNWVDAISPAKINLFLEVLGRRPDGFHELVTVMTTVGLSDRLRFRLRADDQIRLSLLNPDQVGDSVPTDGRNLIVRALEKIRTQYGQKTLGGCDILLYKRIPSEAGLGGASSNAATALLAGNLLWKLKLSRRQIAKVAAELGSDIPFFIDGTTAICRGRGERIEPLPARGGIPIVIVKPPTGLSTKQVFTQFSTHDPPLSVQNFIFSWQSGRIEDFGGKLHNRLTATAVGLNDEIAEVIQRFKRTSAVGHQMSGSGSSYFGIFRSVKSARQAASQLAAQLPSARIYLSQTRGRASLGFAPILI